MFNKNLIDEASEYVKELFARIPHPKLHFHNLNHTKKVVERAREIAASVKPDETGTIIVLLAAWFHDTGYLTGPPLGHEELSIEEFHKFCSIVQLPGDIKNKVEGCIRATRVGESPNNLLEKIISDADTYHFGTREFILTDELLKKEVYALTGSASSNWDEQTLVLLKKHKYYTDYCKKNLAEGKEINCRQVSEKITG
jgi:HD superfamily phosphodiesterase